MSIETYIKLQTRQGEKTKIKLSYFYLLSFSAKFNYVTT